MKLSGAIASGGHLIVKNNGTFEQNSLLALSIASVTVEAGGTLTNTANGATKQSLLNMNIAQDFDLQAGATIALAGLGYAGGVEAFSGSGPGGGDSVGGEHWGLVGGGRCQELAPWPAVTPGAACRVWCRLTVPSCPA